MPTILGAAASGMVHNQNSLDVIGHNVANANSYAYKKFRPLHEGIAQPGAGPEGGRLGVAETTRDLVFSQAATQIVVADVSMSLDNVLAVAGAARDHPTVLVIGLILSIALMGVAANYIARLLGRYPWIAYLGLAIILYVSCDMIYRGAMELWPVVDQAT